MRLKTMILSNIFVAKGINMEIATKAIEMNGTIDKDKHLILDENLPVEGPKRVKVIILMQEEEQISEDEWLKAGASNEVFDFLKDQSEDIYTLEDGKPFNG